MTQRQKSPSFPPLAAIPFGILAVSTSSIFIRFGQEEASSLVIAAYRLTIASAMLLPIVVWRYRPELWGLNRRELALGMLSGLFLAIHFATWITSLEHTTVASSVVLVSTTPLWVALLAPVTLKEPISRAVAIGLLVTLAGGAVVGISDSCDLAASGLRCPPLREFIEGQAFLGNLLALCGALAGAAYLIIGRKLRAKLSLMAYIFLVYGSAAGVLIGIMFAGQEMPFGYSPGFYLWVTLLAIVPQLLGHSTFNWALAFLPAAFVSITLLGEPVGSTILAYYFLRETPSLMKIFGAILILAGIVIASQRTNKQPD